MTLRVGASALALALAAGACGGGQTQGSAFDPAWRDDEGLAMLAFQRRFKWTRAPAGADVAVGVVDGRTLVGAPLTAGPSWSFEHPLDVRPAVAGTVVVGEGAGELFALDARSGRPIWARPAGGQLRGVGDDGATTVVSLTTVTRNKSFVLAIDHDGNMVRQIEDPAPIGVPAVVDGYAFLPWQGKFVTVYDLVAGTEVARAAFPTPTSQAFTAGGVVFFGEAGLTRLDDRIRYAPRGGASTATLPARALPGEPRWLRPGTDVVPVQATGADKVHLYARPKTEGPAGIEGDRYAATYDRIVVGLDATKGSIKWAQAASGDVLGGAAYASGYALCDASGKVTLLDAATGGVAAERSFGRPLQACVVQADALKTTFTGARPALAAQLAAVVRLPDAELVPMQRLLMAEMTALDDDSVTQVLIELVRTAPSRPLIAADARAALAKQRTGVGHMLDALGRHYDFLADALQPPPVAPLADALVALKEKRAAALLATHLNDPADTAEDVQHAAAALAVLADKPELTPLMTFFAAYRGYAEDEALAGAVVDIGRALVRLGAVDVVARAATDPQTLDPLKPRLEELVRQSRSGGDPHTSTRTSAR